MSHAEMAALHGAAFDQSRPWSADEFAALLARPATFAQGDTRAFALVRVIADEAELLTIATHPDHRRRGLARALVQALQATAAEKGASRLFLEVAADNPAAIALYQACGFGICGQRRGYYARETGPAADALVMALDLTQR
ncbi:GNAT family N-acetyltransferase [Arenibacterium sp. CAU 1754]